MDAIVEKDVEAQRLGPEVNLTVPCLMLYSLSRKGRHIHMRRRRSDAGLDHSEQYSVDLHRSVPVSQTVYRLIHKESRASLHHSSAPPALELAKSDTPAWSATPKAPLGE